MYWPFYLSVIHITVAVNAAKTIVCPVTDTAMSLK